MSDFDLLGSRALVIGGSSGIGEAIAAALGRAGARVAIMARRIDRVEEAVQRLRDSGIEADGIAADATELNSLPALAEKIEREGGPIDVLVNSQGTTIIKPALEFTEADYDAILDVNLKSVFFCSLAFGRLMIGRGHGSIINIASLAGHRGWPRATPYSLSKHGVVGLTKSLAGEWAPHGVRVNAISPGFVMTDLNRDKMPPERKERALSRTPLGRFGEVEDVAGAAVYLAAPASEWVTGSFLTVDGGYLGVGI